MIGRCIHRVVLAMVQTKYSGKTEGCKHWSNIACGVMYMEHFSGEVSVGVQGWEQTPTRRVLSGHHEA